ncbi:VOC family protein [Sporolactobacillus vineae]|uniref:VOC family protein n=1 Tax=Sporolactobacillus vineae TaxID=444463 RepID=UPI000288CD81|nr:VOC family protein [Sporolactobacillus vineae]
MTGAEIDFVVTDSLKALALYEKIFDVERVEVTDFPKGENEVIFTLCGVRFHILDENPEFFLNAPNPDEPRSVWFNILVPDVQSTSTRAIDAGCTEIQAVTAMPEYGISNAIFSDPFGYQWMIHQVHKEVSFEERTKMWEEKRE